MGIDIVDPRTVPGWDSFLARNEGISFFHSSCWAAVLAETYRYKPIYLACFDKDAISLVMPLMEIRSLLTGARGVSLPFTDHCVPFSYNDGLLREARERALDYGRIAKWRFIEWRDGSSLGGGAPEYENYLTHDLSLEKNEDELFSGLKDSNRRNIRKSIREGVSIEIAQCMDSLKAFYRLNCLTRRRHGLPPQPYLFYKNVYKHIVSQGYGIVARAEHSGQTIAASVFFLFGTQAIFKFGASDLSSQDLRPNNLLMWETIRWLKRKNFTRLNFGRTEPENEGLLRYKRAWGARETPFSYHRFNYRKGTFIRGFRKPGARRRNFVSKTPLVLLRLIGGLAYRHVG